MVTVLPLAADTLSTFQIAATSIEALTLISQVVINVKAVIAMLNARRAMRCFRERSTDLITKWSNTKSMQ